MTAGSIDQNTLFYGDNLDIFPRISKAPSLTIEQLSGGAKPRMPRRNETAFRTGKRETSINQGEMHV